jgi:Tfp pilus assembly protein PilO
MKIGNINNLPWYARFGMFAALALVVYGGFWYFVTSGTRKETGKLVEQIKVLRKANTEAQIAQQRLTEFKASYKSKQEQLEELRALLPEQRELTKVLEGIQDHARATSISLRKFSPKDDVQQDFYSGKKIEVAVQSSFSGLRKFFDQMAQYQRIVSISNFEIKQLDKQGADKTVEARFDLIAYYVSSEKAQNQQKSGANQSAAGGPQAAQTAPVVNQAVNQAAAPPK